MVMNRKFRLVLLRILNPLIERIITQELREVRNLPLKRYGANNSCDWAAHYIKGRDENIKNLSSPKPVVNKWTEEILKLTNPGESVLEVGSAIGFSSLYLALNNRNVAAMDFSQEMLNAFLYSARKLNLENVRTFCADIKDKIPIGDNSFDVVWHAGLVEHFTESEVQFIINENCRIAKRLVVSMVPNANSLAYRLGKIYQEKNNLWLAGIENPKATQKEYFIKAGLKSIGEYTIDLESALCFLPVNCCHASALKSIYRNLPTEDDCGQGYLLVTIGEK